jgi:hypothetical protein
MLSGFAAPGRAAVPEKPDFNFHVQPILSDRCYFCHGADAAHRKAGLRLDQAVSATKPLKSKAVAIVPGNPEASELMKRLLTHDPEEIMPPPESKLSVTDEEREILRRWIAQGAEYQQHWAFSPPKLPVEPKVTSNQGTLAGPIDAFVLARLQKEGLDFNAEADRARLLRRLSFDLMGLPPSVAEVDAFLADGSANAYEQQVDRLLATPAYGERMAQDWLDVARFADTFGYQSDVTVQNWPYRDWVINAFNQNLPYNRFITEQLAGDLLPQPTRDQLVATAFNRLHRQTNEGGSINEEFRVEYVNDRVQTFGLAFLGLTLECCKCHDHKYDPISTKDYYALGSFFANIDESGLYSHFTNAIPTPTLPLPNSEQDKKLQQLSQEIAAQEDKLQKLRAAALPAVTAWLSAGESVAALPQPIAQIGFEALAGGKLANASDPKAPASTFEDISLTPGKVGQAVQLSGENNINLTAGGKFTRTDAFSFSLWLMTPDVKDRAVIFHRSKAWTDAASCGYELLIEEGRLSAALIHFWPGNALRVMVRDPLPINSWTHLVWSYDGSSKAAGLKLYVNGSLADTEVIRDTLTKDINRGGEDKLTLGQRFRDKGFKGGQIDEFAVYDIAITAAEARSLFAGRPQALQPQEAAEYFLAKLDKSYIAEMARLTELRRSLASSADAIPELMVMKELPQPKPAYILKRGTYDARGDAVTADVPTAILPFPAEAPRNRLGLAQWVTAKQNPLTARVVVNRFWQGLWGTGLVVTAEDFGLQGNLPTHPELLDYLTVRFRDGGWNVKALIKEIVLSRTYRQDSKVPAKIRAQDPENKLLSRGPSARLSAEAVRDQALFVAEQLHRTVGGKSADPDKDNRRSLYTFWKRTMPDVRMELFDMAKREICIARRQVTNTPLQALTLLNEPKFLQSCRRLAERALTQQPELPARIRFLYRTLISEEPSPAELAILKQLHTEQLAAFQTDSATPSFLATTGSDVNAALPAADLAATTMLASAIMNFDSFIMKR